MLKRNVFPSKGKLIQFDVYRRYLCILSINSKLLFFIQYEYKYDVEDQEKALYFGANEAGDAQGKVIGGYRVLLPDGRLMTVEYTVEGDSGFVPKITFEDNANPFGKGK